MIAKRGFQVLLAAAWLGFSTSSFGVVWHEVMDAGETPPTAQTTGFVSIQAITGQLDFDIDTGLYDVDLFEIVITDPTLFSAATEEGDDRITDPALWLFDMTGNGVYMNDDAGPVNLQSRLPVGHAAGPVAPGHYLLAVSFSFFDPVDLASAAIFPIYRDSLPTDGVYGPSGGTGPLASWIPNPLREDLPSSYRIALTAVIGSVPEPTTLALLAIGLGVVAWRFRRRERGTRQS